MNNIKHYREKAGLTQAQLARKMEVDQSAICKWETGKNPPLQKYQRKLAKVLGVTMDKLFAEEVSQ